MGKKKNASAAGADTSNKSIINHNSINDEKCKTVCDDDTLIDVSDVDAITPEEAEESQKWRQDGKYKGIYNPRSRARDWIAICYPEPIENVLGTTDKAAVLQHIIHRCEGTCIPFAISPLHCNDLNADGSKKKDHYHLAFRFNGSTTAKAASERIRAVTMGPYPLKCISVRGSVRYFTHADNPEKAQYCRDEIVTGNGFRIPLDASEKVELLEVLRYEIIRDDIQSFAQLCVRYADDSDYSDTITSYHVYLRNFIKDYTANIEEVCRAYVAAAEEHGVPLAERNRIMDSICDRKTKRHNKRVRDAIEELEIEAEAKAAFTSRHLNYTD